MVRTAVFPVGGLGTRFLPATKAVPKEMLPIVDKPLIQYAVEEARDAGIEHFVFVTSHGKTAVENHFDRDAGFEAQLRDLGKEDLIDQVVVDGTLPGRLSYVRQMEPMGLGHAVWCARQMVGEQPFAVLLADELLIADRPPLADLIDVHEETGGNVISVIEVAPEETGSYGIVEAGSVNGRRVEVRGLVEKPDPAVAPSRYAIAGRYILEPGIMGVLEEGKIGAGGEIQLTDAMAQLIGGIPFDAVVHRGERYDCGSKVGFIEASVALALGRDDLEGVEAAVRRALGDQAAG
jgi:UTP--glucose-1-phosphate uridylyltransferase